MENNTILITGGAGFIGLNFINLVLKERPSTKIICVDILTYAANVDEILNLADKITFIKVDITDEQAIDDIFKEYNPDIVVNFAAESHVDNSINNPNIFTKTNIFGTQVLMNACLKYNVKRFHQVSTDEVYGDLPLNSDKKFCETSPLRPSSPYSASKTGADLMCLAYFKTFGLPVTISRCSNNYGPYQHKEKLIPHMISKLKSDDKRLPVYGTGENIRDWIYVEDHCRGILAVLDYGKPGEIYNLGTNSEKTNNEIVRLILKEFNEPESLITYVNDRKGHDLRYAIDASKANTELNWWPKHKFEEAIKYTINWYKDR